MLAAKEILIKYWGHTSFRPMQEEIIQAALEKKTPLLYCQQEGENLYVFKFLHSCKMASV